MSDDINQDLNIPGENPAAQEPGAMPESKDPAAKPARKARASKTEDKAPEVLDPMEQEVVITLHNSDEVPPGGQYVAVNGVGITIPVNQKCKIKRKYLNVLRDANSRTPILDENHSVVGYQERMRFNVEVHG